MTTQKYYEGRVTMILFSYDEIMLVGVSRLRVRRLCRTPVIFHLQFKRPIVKLIDHSGLYDINCKVYFHDL